MTTLDYRPARKHRVWTRNWAGRGEVYSSSASDWKTRAECKQCILNRWGHWPPFAFISTAETVESFNRANGFKDDE